MNWCWLATGVTEVSVLVGESSSVGVIEQVGVRVINEPLKSAEQAVSLRWNIVRLPARS